MGIQNGDELNTNLKQIKQQISQINAENILCILSTTSCFAPRAPDNIIEIGKICKAFDIYHVVNNAYGVQSLSTCKMIQKCAMSSRIDVLIQSTDKNFLVPVGGSIVASIVDTEFIDELATMYPGRASISPILDLFITLNTMGKHKWNSMRRQREENFIYFKDLLHKVFEPQSDGNNLYLIREHVLDTPNNPISIGLTLNTLFAQNESVKDVTKLGSMLFSRNVSGSRIVCAGMKKKVKHFEFDNYGSHVHGGYHSPYLTVAAAIGMSKGEINEFVLRLLKCFHKILKIKKSQNQLIMDEHMKSFKYKSAENENQIYAMEDDDEIDDEIKQPRMESSMYQLTIGISIGIMTGIIL